MIPVYGNFVDAQSCALRKIKQLDVKREAIQASGFQNRAAGVDPKCFKTTLRVPKRQASDDSDKKIEDAASLFTPPRLVLTDQAAIQCARTNGNVDFTVGNWLD